MPATTAGAMLEADLTGSDAHGVFRLAGYVRQLRRGVMNPKATISVIERGPATALVDGDNGMGHVVMSHAAKLAVELARACGVGWVGARRSNHAGAGAIYAAIPLEHGMVGIYGAASSVNHMAPWGGTEPLLGTNPIAVAIPAGKEAPVILDIATSTASNGAIRTYELDGRPMPEGWVQSRKDGSPITDPSRIGEGTYLPIGGYKGSGLSLIIGLLAGPLNGAAFGRDVRDFAAPPAGELNVGQFVVALDVARFVPLGSLPGGDRPPHPRSCLVSAAAGGRRYPRARTGAPRAPQRAREGRRPARGRAHGASRRGRNVARHQTAQRTRMGPATMSRVPDAVQRTQTSLRSLRKLDCAASSRSGAPLSRDRSGLGIRNGPGCAAYHAKPRAAPRPGHSTSCVPRMIQRRVCGNECTIISARS